MKSIGTRLFPRWLNVIMNFPESYDTEQDQLKVFWRAPITDTVGSPAEHPTPVSTESAFHSCYLELAASAIIPDNQADERPSEVESAFFALIGQHASSNSIPPTTEVLTCQEQLLIKHNQGKEKVKRQTDVSFLHAVLL